MNQRTWHLVLTSLLLAACGGSSSKSSSSSVEEPEPILGTVALAFDLAHHPSIEEFRITVERVELRGDGGPVALLEVPLDLVARRPEDAAQVLRIGQVEVGLYTHVSVKLGWHRAEAWSFAGEDDLLLVDPGGSSFSAPATYDLRLPLALGVLEDAGQALMVDLDLARSLRIDGQHAILEPVVEARVDYEQRECALVATLIESHGESSALTARRFGPGAEDLGLATLQTTTSTLYEVDGEVWYGDQGFAVLHQYSLGTPMEVHGYQVPGGDFQAEFVRAGFGTLSGSSGVIEGYIVDRIQGPYPDLELLVRTFEDGETEDVWVKVDLSRTHLLQSGSAYGLIADRFWVGQRVRAHGTFDDDGLDASDYEGVLRLMHGEWLAHPTTEIVSGRVTLSLDRLGPHGIEGFQWGARDPDALLMVVPGALQGEPIEPGEVMRLRALFANEVGVDDGFVSAFSQPHREDPLLRLQDREAGRAVTTDFSAISIGLELAGAPGAGEWFVVDRAEAGSEPLEEGALVLEAPYPGGAYSIRHRATGEVFQTFTFGEFRNHWAQYEATGARLWDLEAWGDWDPTQRRLRPSRLSLILD